MSLFRGKAHKKLIAATIETIEPGSPTSWFKKVYLTFDMDWAHDDVILDTIDILESKDVAATWFVTHDTPVLSRLRENPKFELGIHPNFNWLLAGDTRNGRDAREVLHRLLDIVPEAKSVRSHSMLQSSILLDLFYSAGLTHDVNHFVPHWAGTALGPWVLWNGLIRVPYIWEDDISSHYESVGQGEQALTEIIRTGNGVKVLDFHPIHIYLNTEHLSRYEKTRNIHQDPRQLFKNRNLGIGARSRLQDLILEIQ